MLDKKETRELINLLDIYNWEMEELNEEEQNKIFEKIEEFKELDFDNDFVVFGKINKSRFKFDLKNMIYYEL